MIAHRRYLAILLAALCGLSVSCDGSRTKTPPGAVVINGAGATFPAPLYEKWIEEFQKQHEDVIVEYQAVGSGEGIKRFTANAVDFGASDAAMRDEEMAKVERGARLIPATAGIIVLAYDIPGLGGNLKLPRDVYADIFRGEIELWDDPRIRKANPSLNPPRKEIVIVARQDSSGTTFAFTNHLSVVNAEWRDRGPGTGKVIDWPGSAMLVHGNEGVAGRIKISEGAIGYVEYGYAKRAGLPMAWLENKEGRFVEPGDASGDATLKNTQEQMPPNLRMFLPDPSGETSYPLVTYTWLLLYEAYPDKEKLSALKSFVQWGLTEGQRYGDPLGYCKLPQGVIDRALAALAKIKVQE